MIEFIAIPIYCLLVILLAALILYSYDKILFFKYRDKRSPEEKRRDEELHIQSLLNPQFEEIEKYYSFTIPEKLKEFYSQHEIITDNGFLFKDQETEDYIEEFLPINLRTIKELDIENTIPFGVDGCGNYYCIKTEKNNSSVYFWDHEIFWHGKGTNPLEEHGISITDFLNRKIEKEEA